MGRPEFEKAARAHAESRSSEGTKYLYNSDLTRWLLHCQLEAVDPSAPTLEVATSFRDDLKRKYADQTVRRILSALSSMYAFAIEYDPSSPKATCNPFKTRSLPRPSAFAYAQTEALSDADALKVIAVAEADTGLGDRDAAILWLLYETGMRVSSAVSLRKADLFDREGALLARIRVKGGKWREVGIPARARKALEIWMQRPGRGAYVFPPRRGPGHLAARAINKRLERYGAQAGVEHVHPHRFRASYITSAFDAKIPLVEVQAAVHHEDPKTTLRYDRGVRGTQVADAVSRYRKGE